MRRVALLLLCLAGVAAGTTGCGDDTTRGDGGGRRSGGRFGSGGGPPGFGAGGADIGAVPVEVARVERRAISAYIETNGTLEAENEVDIVARAAAPILELFVEEGDAVREGQLLARLDDTEFRAELEIARVAVDERKQAYERARSLYDQKLLSSETHEQAVSAYDSARAQYEASRILLGYAEIPAPFGGLIVARYVDAGEQVAVNSPLFRISDFDPLLCPIQVPERDLSRLHQGQAAWLEVESWPGERFPANVLRISPVIDAATGTIKVTLQATEPQRLRPGMFARVFLEAETKPGALVIPKSALSLESIGDTVYVVDGNVASRREVTLGYEEGDFVEALSGVAEGESIVVVGQDGLSDGTPIQPFEARSPVARKAAPSGPAPADAAAGEPSAGAPPERSRSAASTPDGRGGPRFDPSEMTPERLEQIKERMRARGLTEEQIEERLRRFQEQAKQDGE